MTSRRAFILLLATLTLTACGAAKNVASSSTPLASMSTAVNDPTQVTDDDSAVDCAELGNSGYPFITQQSNLKIQDQEYQVATVACSTDSGEASAEVVESFILDNGVWASNGLASGPDLAFRTTGECSSDGSQVQCPANVTSEDGSAISGMVVIANDNGQPAWSFSPLN